MASHNVPPYPANIPLPAFLEDIDLYSPPPPEAQPTSPTSIDIDLGQMIQDFSPSHDYLDLENNNLDDDIELVTASLKAEATGTVMPIIKDEIRYNIQKRRRESGQEPLKPDYKEDGPEKLTKTDIVRRERRKASNRRAATKCRNKKKIAEEAKEQEFVNLKLAKQNLELEVQSLKSKNERLTQYLHDHSKMCPLMPPLNGEFS